MGATAVGVVQSLHRFPVKSMLGEELRRIQVGPRGVAGDRAYALVDDETGKVVSVKRPKRWSRMFELSAFTRGDTVHVQVPDQPALPIDDPTLPGRLGGFLGRSVSIASEPPEGATFDEVWMRDLKNGIDPLTPSRIEDGEEMIDNGQLMCAIGNFSNGGAIHLVTTSTTRRFGALAPDSMFEPKRFRPNIVVETDADGFVEGGWAGKMLVIGEVRMAVLVQTPRCVMTTLAQGGAPADRGVLRSIARHNTVDIGFGVFPCLGVYADVRWAGEIKIGDPVMLD